MNEIVYVKAIVQGEIASGQKLVKLVAQNTDGIKPFYTKSEDLIFCGIAEGRRMVSIKINKDNGEVLILKTDLLLHPRDVEKVRNNVIQQIEGGAVVIPNGFTYAIYKRDCIEHLEVVTRKRMIDVDMWIDTLAKIISDPEAPGAYKDYCFDLVNSIETEYRAQEVQAMQEGKQ